MMFFFAVMFGFCCVMTVLCGVGMATFPDQHVIWGVLIVIFLLNAGLHLYWLWERVP